MHWFSQSAGYNEATAGTVNCGVGYFSSSLYKESDKTLYSQKEFRFISDEGHSGFSPESFGGFLALLRTYRASLAIIGGR